MATVSKSIQKAGDVFIDEVLIVSATGLATTITPQVVGISLYEDIFAPFISGQLIVRDSQDLINHFPLIGEERLQLKFSTPELPTEAIYEGTYYIYKADNKVQMAEREVAYVLHFISEEAITDLNKKVSRAYRGKVSEIVTEILTGSDGLATTKKINIEESKNDTMFISNWWSPLKNIQYATESAYNMDDSPSYIFFENKYGLNWVTLSSLYREGEPAQHKFIYDNYRAEISPSGGSRRSLEEDYKRIIDFDQPVIFDYIHRLKSGVYGSEIIYYDIMTQQYVHKGHVSSWEGNSHLNDNPMWTPNVAARPRAKMFVGNQYYNNFDGFDGRTAGTKTIQERTALLAQAESYKCTITVFGRTDYSAGQKVYLEIPKNTQIKSKDGDWLDGITSGNYLISSIHHSINRKEYKCVMELIKDSYITDVSKS